LPTDLGRSQRGRRLDDLIPETVDRSVRRPHVAPNPYIGHRVTLQVGDRVACDCGETFDTATDLEAHQSPYRHRVPDFSRRPRTTWAW
jgi:hypothetical protein